MNWVDLIVILIIGLFVANGYRKGFIHQLGDLILLIASIVISMAFFNNLAVFLSSRFDTVFLQGIFGKIAALVILWVGTQIIFFFLFKVAYHALPEGIRNSKINKGLGAVPGFLWGLLFTLVLFILVSVTLGFVPKYQNYKQAMNDSATGKAIVSRESWLSDGFFGQFGANFGSGLTFRTIEPNSSETYDLGFKTTDVKSNRAAAEQMLELVNKEREAAGLKPLSMDEKLVEVAEAHSKDMFARGYFAHNTPEGKDPFDRMKEAGVVFLIAGENLALAPDVASAHKGLMDSPGHRANILSPDYGKVGIGAIDGGKYGIMFSQEFTN